MSFVTKPAKEDCGQSVTRTRIIQLLIQNCSSKFFCFFLLFLLSTTSLLLCLRLVVVLLTRLGSDLLSPKTRLSGLYSTRCRFLHPRPPGTQINPFPSVFRLSTPLLDLGPVDAQTGDRDPGRVHLCCRYVGGPSSTFELSSSLCGLPTVTSITRVQDVSLTTEVLVHCVLVTGRG